MQDEGAGASKDFGWGRGGWPHAGLNRFLPALVLLLIIEHGVFLTLLSLHGFAATAQAVFPAVGIRALWLLSLGTLAFASAVLFTATVRARRGGPRRAGPSLPPSWEAANRRRIRLIDKDLDGSITASEKAELQQLEEFTGRLLDLSAPLPTVILEDLRRAVHEAEERSRPGGG